MGNDGGSIPTRRELVKESAKTKTATQIKESRVEQQTHLWNVDQISGAPLATPIVSDQLGRLFNKDSVIEVLLPDADTEKREVVKDVKSLKDVVDVKFEVEGTLTGGGERKERWVCPVTRQELGPASRAVYLVPCGHAFSGAAMEQIPTTSCITCNAEFHPDNIIPIFPLDTSRLISRAASLKERGLTHSLKKASNKKHKSEVLKEKESRAPTIKNSSTASLTKRVLEEQDEINKRRKLERNANVSSLFSTTDSKAKQKDIGFMNRGFAIPGRR